MEYYFIILIAVACLFGLYILYRLMGVIMRFLRWLYKKAMYEGCCRPVGHCCRDSIFSCKECCCECCEECHLMANPYKRI